MLDGLDVIEEIFRSMQRQLEADHERMADREQMLAEAFDRIRMAEEKICLLEERIRLDMARKFGHSSERWKADEKLQALLFDELEVALKQASDLLAGDASTALATMPIGRAGRSAGKASTALMAAGIRCPRALSGERQSLIFPRAKRFVTPVQRRSCESARTSASGSVLSR